MRLQKQTIEHDPAHGRHGNCFSAVLAALLHLEVDQVPVFSGEDWDKHLNAWLAGYGLAWVPVSNFDEVKEGLGILGCHHEVGSYTERGPTMHAYVGVDGKIVYDPSIEPLTPRGARHYGLLVALRPWELVLVHGQKAA